MNVWWFLQWYPLISEFYHPNGINYITFHSKPAFINNMRLLFFPFLDLFFLRERSFSKICGMMPERQTRRMPNYMKEQLNSKPHIKTLPSNQRIISQNLCALTQKPLASQLESNSHTHSSKLNLCTKKGLRKILCRRISLFMNFGGDLWYFPMQNAWCS